MNRSAWTNAVASALVLALLAVGVAGAAEMITGADIKDFSIEAKDLTKKAQRTLEGRRGERGRRGRRGRRGPVGATGSQGTQGIQGIQGVKGDKGDAGNNGATGPAAASVITGSVAGNPITDSFATPSGVTASTEANAQVPVPPGATLTARDFTATATVAPTGAGHSWTVILRVDATDALKCTIADTATSCESTATAALAAGSKINIKITPAMGPAPANVAWAFRVVQ